MPEISEKLPNAWRGTYKKNNLPVKEFVSTTTINFLINFSI